MRLIKTIREWRQYQETIAKDASMGFVATMGCLHQGHASLIERSKKENDITAISIFVNPTQFNHPEDFKYYPNTLDDDIAMAKALGVDALFHPRVEEMYPLGNHLKIRADTEIACILEGEFRPGHFDGVLTVVMKLFGIIQPTRAYFGEKDFQQLTLIQQMVKNYFLPIEIISCSTKRDELVLALSSRNKRLTSEQYQTAVKFAKIFRETTPENIDKNREKIEALGVSVEYFFQYENRFLIAVYVGNVRLIDNFELTREEIAHDDQ